MANNNKLSMFANAKVRLIAAIIVALAVIGAVAGVLVYVHHKSLDSGSANVVGGPGNLGSVPGQTAPSADYIQKQNAQNAQEALTARNNATSAIPTITGTDFLSNLQDMSNQESATTATPSGHSCPLKQVEVMFKPNPASCLPQNIALARDAGVTAEELRCQGCSCPSLKLAGYTAGDLKGTGYEASELKQCGFSIDQLVQAGYSAVDLHNAGFSAKDLADAGFSPGQLQYAGYAVSNPSKTDCSVSALQAARASGVTATTLRSQGCGVAALKAAGFTAGELRAAGFSAEALKNAGYTAAELKAAGYSAPDLAQAGFSDKDLQVAGYTPADIAQADKVTKSCSIDSIKKQYAAGASAVALKNEGCGIAALKAAGLSAAQLRAAGFSADQLKDAGFSAQDLHDAGYTAAQLKAAGFSAKQLHDAGYSAAALKGLGLSAADLHAAGYSADDLHKAGFTAAQLKTAGFNAGDLKKAGLGADDLKAAGFGAGQLKDAGFDPTEISAAGFTTAQLHNAGFSAADLKQAGFSPAILKVAGYTDGDLLRAGFTPAQSGYTQAVSKGVLPVTIPQQQQPQSISQNQSPIPSAGANSSDGKLAAIMRAEQNQMSEQQRLQAMQQDQAMMLQQAGKLLGDWSASSNQQMQKAIEDKSVLTSASSGSASGSAQNTGGPIIKAGTIMFAVLDTSIDTDENTPIMARIVTGPLQGSKLLGSFVRVNQRVLLKFNLLNSPSYQRTLPVDAVAIDPDTARTAMSGQVNNHYLLRYGSLFASAFLEGFSNALTSTATSNSCAGSPICFVTQSSSPLSTGQQAVVAMGTVGSRYSSVMGSNFSTPPTVKIPGGTGVGLLIMSDVQLPLGSSS